MKERIEQLAAGEVLVKKPELDFSPAYLEGRVEAGTVQNKELVIRVRNRVPFKGFFYSKVGGSAVSSRPRKNDTPFQTVRSKHRLFTERRN